jgi:uncharacterized protein
MPACITLLPMDIALIRSTLLAEAPRLQAEFGAMRFWVFGSRARNEEQPESDLDLLVEFGARAFSLLDFLRLEQELSELFGIKVDLVDIEALRSELRPSVITGAIAV